MFTMFLRQKVFYKPGEWYMNNTGVCEAAEEQIYIFTDVSCH